MKIQLTVLAALSITASAAAAELDGVAFSNRIGTAQFMVRDWKANSGFIALDGDAAGLHLDQAASSRGAARLLDITLSDKTGSDRAVTLLWAMPLPDGELTWFDTPRTRHDLTAARTERSTTKTAPCGRGQYSPWPLIAVAAGTNGCALGVDPQLPGFFRLAVNPELRLVTVAYDIALTPERPTARVGFVAFPFTARDGLRGALESYQRLFPEFNEVRQKRQGSWMAFHPISKIKGWEDFGFAIKEGDGEVAWDDAHGISTYRYTEPSTWWMSISGTNGIPTMGECIAHANALTAPESTAPQMLRQFAKAWATCAMKDADGQPLGRIQDTPWCKGIVWNLNCAPGLGPDAEFAMKHPAAHFEKHYHPDSDEGLEGEYIDSAEMYVTAALDFNRANFAGMATPLVFDAKTLRPAVFKGLMACEYVRGVFTRARARNGRTMANGTPIQWCWLVPYLDVLGTETNWHVDGKWNPHSHDLMIYMRALCGGKPFCYLQNTDFTTFTSELCEKFMQRALAYGMYPGFFSPNAADGHYFSNPKCYERDRPLFRKYMPLCRRIGEAGWCPVNRLLPVDPQTGVLAEQFGDRYVTLFNSSETETRTISVPAVRELVTDTPARGELTLPPETCRILDFDEK